MCSRNSNVGEEPIEYLDKPGDAVIDWRVIRAPKAGADLVVVPLLKEAEGPRMAYRRSCERASSESRIDFSSEAVVWMRQTGSRNGSRGRFTLRASRSTLDAG